ncbi:ankyrin repeat-containing protein At5g02620-like isoform X2 [Cornus florida]|uniref:ankyrin repeat-containing protein At5g02620-like isoform X2 n=1 Tax=Cornus florida TaxID=4283 RepID=UPI0028A007EB|nr:ankyrin repeat-containing protein At5g02620-like isoform X2 [Cornus florida]
MNTHFSPIMPTAAPPPPPPPPAHPLRLLLQPPPPSSKAGRDDIIKYIPLYRALVNGELERVKAFLEKDPNAVYANISTKGEKPIHIAVLHGHEKLVEELLKNIDAKRLRILQDDNGDTALHVAARGGNKRIAEALVNAVQFAHFMNKYKHIPLALAAIHGNKESLEVIRRIHTQVFYQAVKAFVASKTLFREFIESQNFDIDMLPVSFEDSKSCPQSISIVQSTGVDMQPVNVHTKSDIEKQPEDSRSHRFSRFKDKLYSTGSTVKRLMSKVAKTTGIEEILNMKKKDIQARQLLSKMCSPIWTFDFKYIELYFEAIKVAIKCGNVGFVKEVLRSNPTLLWGDKKNQTIFHIAVACRQEKIWNLIYGLTTEQRNKILGILVETNSMLHIAAYPLVVQHEGSEKQAAEQLLRTVFVKAPGAAMKMQRELQWYEEVKKMVPSSYKFLPNENGETPQALFSKWHSDLVKEGEKWMRDTATSCTIVATLIVTVMFAAVFTVPGGIDDSGNPKFLQHNSFIVFVVSDALSLFSSVTAVLMFLSILTSRFEEKDFLKALPNRLIIGLAALFLSIATMMVAFGVTLVIVIGKRIRWAVAVAPVAVLASFPIILFALLQLPLFVDMVLSTYGGGIFNRKTKCSFFNNPNDDYVPPQPKDRVDTQ